MNEVTESYLMFYIMIFTVSIWSSVGTALWGVVGMLLNLVILTGIVIIIYSYKILEVKK